MRTSARLLQLKFSPPRLCKSRALREPPLTEAHGRACPRCGRVWRGGGRRPSDTPLAALLANSRAVEGSVARSRVLRPFTVFLALFTLRTSSDTDRICVSTDRSPTSLSDPRGSDRPCTGWGSSLCCWFGMWHCPLWRWLRKLLPCQCRSRASRAGIHFASEFESTGKMC